MGVAINANQSTSFANLPQIKMEETAAEEGPTRASFTDHLRSASPDEYFKANKTGRLLSSGQLQIILNVYTWLRKATPPMMPTDAAIRAAEMCGVGVKTVVKARKTIRDGKMLASPKRTRTFREKKIPANTILDDFTKSSVRRKVHEAFFIKENVTLEGLKRKIDSDQSFPKMSRSTLHRCLKMVGFRYEKMGQNKVMLEREDIILWRRNYIRQIRQHRQQCRPIVYLDETWLKSVSTIPKTARQAFVEGLLSADGNGGNCIIMHDGKKDACVGSIQIAFLAKRDKGDSVEMNEERFQKWVEERLLPNIPETSVIVVDNSSYHTAQDTPLPERSAKKCVIQEWLTKRNIPWTSNMSKGDLHATLVANKQKTKHYAIDQLVQDKGYDILRLPPYHFELNPIEMAWGQVKQQVAITTATFKMKDMREKLGNAVAAVTLKDWENYVDQVMKIEESFWLVDCLQGEHEGLGIRLDDMDCEEDMDEDVNEQEWT